MRITEYNEATHISSGFYAPMNEISQQVVFLESLKCLLSGTASLFTS